MKERLNSSDVLHTPDTRGSNRKKFLSGDNHKNLSRTMAEPLNGEEFDSGLNFDETRSSHSRMSRQNKSSFLGRSMNKLKKSNIDNESSSSLQGSQMTADEMGWINQISFKSHKESKEKRDLENAIKFIYI